MKKYIATVLFLIVFLLPSVIKFEHHHNHFVSDAGESDGNKPYAFSEKCLICNFEFSAFVTSDDPGELPRADHPYRYRNKLTCRLDTDLVRFSFHLRAPPLKQA